MGLDLVLVLALAYIHILMCMHILLITDIEILCRLSNTMGNFYFFHSFRRKSLEYSLLWDWDFMWPHLMWSETELFRGFIFIETRILWAILFSTKTKIKSFEYFLVVFWIRSQLIYCIANVITQMKHRRRTYISGPAAHALLPFGERELEIKRVREDGQIWKKRERERKQRERKREIEKERKECDKRNKK